MTVREIIKKYPPADPFKYQMLDRMRTDCDYFLGNGHRDPAV